MFVTQNIFSANSSVLGFDISEILGMGERAVDLAYLVEEAKTTGTEGMFEMNAACLKEKSVGAGKFLFFE